MTNKSRLSNEARRAQYELPGFAAGICISQIDHARRLLQAHEVRYGQNALIRNVDDTLGEIRESIVSWQMYARLVTDYELAHRAVTEERE
jgi:hypothetical protein